MVPEELDQAAGGESMTRFIWGCFLRRYLLARSWLRADRFRMSSSGTATFCAETSLWAAQRANQLWETRRLRLDGFQLMEWLPVQPGVYHDRDSARWRAEAFENVAALTEAGVVFDRYGKGSMIGGGIGCMRLSMKACFDGEYKFLSATSTGVAHRGFIVAVAAAQYASIAEQIAAQGVVACTLEGEIRQWRPPADSSLFGADFSQIILRVDRLKHAGYQEPAGPARATPMLTFRSPLTNRGAPPDHVWSTYGSLRPGVSGDIERCRDWMINDYVTGRYQGIIVTDCDELAIRFSDVVCPLDAVMNPTLAASALAKSLRAHGLTDGVTIIEHMYAEHLEVDHVSTFNVTGDGNVIGNDNHVVTTVNKSLSESPAGKEIAEALALLRAEVSVQQIDDRFKQRADRAIADMEDELIEREPDASAVHSAFNRVRDAMKAAGATYDETTAWGRRLAELIGVLSPVIPAAMHWLGL